MTAPKWLKKVGVVLVPAWKKLRVVLSRVRWVALVLATGALALIWWGLWQIYSPVAPLAVGSLVWLDLALSSRTVRRK